MNHNNDMRPMDWIWVSIMVIFWVGVTFMVLNVN